MQDFKLKTDPMNIVRWISNFFYKLLYVVLNICLTLKWRYYSLFVFNYCLVGRNEIGRAWWEIIINFRVAMGSMKKRGRDYDNWWSSAAFTAMLLSLLIMLLFFSLTNIPSYILYMIMVSTFFFHQNSTHIPMFKG